MSIREEVFEKMGSVQYQSSCGKKEELEKAIEISKSYRFVDGRETTDEEAMYVIKSMLLDILDDFLHIVFDVVSESGEKWLEITVVYIDDEGEE